MQARIAVSSGLPKARSVISERAAMGSASLIRALSAPPTPASRISMPLHVGPTRRPLADAARSASLHSRRGRLETGLLHRLLHWLHLVAGIGEQGLRLVFEKLVGGPGFEPGTSRSRTVRAAKLR